MSYYSRTLRMPFKQAIERVTANLKQQGFGVITQIDLQDTFKQKLNVGFRQYCILGACNPQFAYKAVSLESHVGIMLPCNVVVQDHPNGEVEVSAINPLENMTGALDVPQLAELAMQVGSHLRAAIDGLDHKHNEPEALPTEPGCTNCIFPMQG